MVNQLPSRQLMRLGFFLIDKHGTLARTAWDIFILYRNGSKDEGGMHINNPPSE